MNLQGHRSANGPHPGRGNPFVPPAHLRRIVGRLGYKITGYLGGGTFGQSYAIRSPDGFDLALKVVRLDSSAGEVELRSLDIIRNVRHPHVLPIIRTWQVDGYLLILMELATGTLADRLRYYIGMGLCGIPAVEAIEYVSDAAKGLDYLNCSNILHQDVKPENLLLVGGCVKVGDFGLVSCLRHSRARFDGGMTVAYAPPEFFKEEITRWSDQYQLAATYCRIRGGRTPFVGRMVDIIYGHLNESPDLSMLPPSERPVVEKALAKDPSDRWSSCREFAEELRRCPPDEDETAPVTLCPPPRGPRDLMAVDEGEMETSFAIMMHEPYVRSGCFA